MTPSHIIALILLVPILAACEKSLTTAGISSNSGVAYDDSQGQILSILGSQAQPADAMGFDGLDCLPMIEVSDSVSEADPQIHGGSICFVTEHHHQ